MSVWNGLPLVIFGTGSTSKEIGDFIETINDNKSKAYDLLGYVDDSCQNIGKVYNGKRIVASDDTFDEFVKEYRILGAVIPFGIVEIKRRVAGKILKCENVVFPNIIHPSVIYNNNSIAMGYGNVIYPGAVLTKDITIGNFNTINMNVTIGHDVAIGDYNVINPGVAISGNINIQNEITIGTGTNIVQGLTIGSGSFIGAGSVVIENIKEKESVSGNFAIDHRKNLKDYMKSKL